MSWLGDLPRVLIHDDLTAWGALAATAFGAPGERSSRVLSQNSGDLQYRDDILRHANPDPWDNWLATDPTFRSVGQEHTGFSILMVARPVSELPPVVVQQIEAGLHLLPVPQDTWARVARRARISPCLPGVLLSPAGHMSFASGPDPRRPGAAVPETVHQFTVVMPMLPSPIRLGGLFGTPTIGGGGGGDGAAHNGHGHGHGPPAGSPPHSRLALCCTHFRKRRMTRAVVLGCTTGRMQRLRAILGGGVGVGGGGSASAKPQVRGHPLVVLAAFAELQRAVVDEWRAGLLRSCHDVLRAVSLGRPGPPARGGRSRRRLDWPLTNAMWQCQDAAVQFESRVGAFARQCREVLARIREERVVGGGDGGGDADGNSNFDGGGGGGGAERDYEQEAADRAIVRRLERALDFDDMIAEVRRQADAVVFTGQLVQNELDRRMATFGTVLAVVATLYLPIGAVTGILAMPIFNFQNDWRDVLWRQSGDNNDNNSTAAAAAVATSPSSFTATTTTTSRTATTVPSITSSATGATAGAAVVAAAQAAPVVSGYIWIWLGVTVGMLLGTVGGFVLYARSRDVERRWRTRGGPA